MFQPSKSHPVRIKNTFHREVPGTLINSVPTVSEQPIKGISPMKNIALLLVSGGGMVGISGIAERLFASLAKEQINVILITQASSEYSICLAIERSQAERAKEVIEAAFALELQSGLLNPIKVEDRVAIIAVVGNGMREKPGSAGRLFQTLGKHHINIMAIARVIGAKYFSRHS